MTRAGFDLSDRGVTGRHCSRRDSICSLWTERGIYRPGETVHASALARDIEADSMPSPDCRSPSSSERPDGVEAFRRMVVTSDAGLGGYAVDYAPARQFGDARHLEPQAIHH